jgi:hypothetical protein
MKLNQIKTKTLSEALTTPYPYKWTTASAHQYKAEYDHLSIGFKATGENKNNWEIMFTVGKNIHTTGEGEAFKILSTVVAATKEWWSRQNPKNVRTIAFSSTKDDGTAGTGRDKLYQRFTNQFAKSIGFTSRTITYSSINTIAFELTNPSYNKFNEDGRVVKGVNTTADVKPGETRRQAAKFGNKVNHKNEPPLLNDRARRNSNPHILSNLGLTEARKMNLDTFANKLKRNYKLQDLWLNDWEKRGAIEVASIIVGKENQKTGIGSAVMTEIINFADAHGKILALDPALKDKNHGTTSQTRLRKFYKRFGFIDNKGSKKNYEFRSGMIRYPKSAVNESVQLTELFNKIHDWDWNLMDDNAAQATFLSADDGDVRVGFTYDSRQDTWEVEFIKNFKYNATNEGDQFAIFATVMEIIGDFVHIRHPNSIVFTAEKNTKTSSNSRAGLYTKMINKFANKINMKSTVNDQGWKTDYKLVKESSKSVKLTELFNKTHTWNWVSKSPTLWKASFESADGGNMEVYFQSVNAKSTHYDVAFRKGDTIKRTGEGDQFAILATVMDVIDGFLKVNTAAESIGFAAKREGAAADDPKIRDSRASLYKKMLTKVAKANNFEIVWQEVARMTEFLLRREVPKPAVKESTSSMQYGYKIMNYDPDTDTVISGADSRVTQGLKIKKGMVMKMPAPGIFMSTNRKYVETYYGGHNDHEVLIKFEFDPSAITSGNLTDNENEFTVLSAKVVGLKIMNNLDEAITSLDNPKSEKFGIKFDTYKPEGKQIGKVGKYQLWFTNDHTKMMSPAAQIWDPKAKAMAGVIKLEQDRRMKLSAKTYITGTAVVNEAYAGKGVVYKGYVALLKLGYNLISDNYQSEGGKKIWARLANTSGVHVYAIIPGEAGKRTSEAGKRTKYSAVDADDLTSANFQVYNPTAEDEEYEEQLDDRYDELSQELLQLGANDDIEDHKDKIAMVKKELDATIRDRVALDKKAGPRTDARLMATAEILSESIKKPRPEDTLGVRRADMPQVHASHYPELFNYLKANGATISKSSVQASELKAVQGEFSDEGVEKMMRKTDKDGGTTRKKPLIVSADNYIIDGHHRWLAAYNMDEQVPIIKFSLPVSELLQLVKDFKHTTYRGIYKEAKATKPKYSVMEQACIDGGHDLADIQEIENEKETKRRRSNSK